MLRMFVNVLTLLLALIAARSIVVPQKLLKEEKCSKGRLVCEVNLG
jgi:hypothetical protein